ncbi:MAG: threonylcarbamoyl-AMP synthase, partial [Actinobacteria bacterium]|nr:threonylcarbamoyl-AMP synthase [Actinomycetota bacterium]
HPLIVHIHSHEQISYWAIRVPEYALALANAFWPGPMTLILPRAYSAKDFVTGGQDSVGLRVPNHKAALDLLSAFMEIGGQGIAAPSANRFGKVSPTTAQDVRAELGDYLDADDLILEGGPSEVGIESTIIDCTGPAPRVLRPGSVTAEMISAVTSLKLGDYDEEIRVSGAMESHYAPSAQVILDEQPAVGDGFIAMENVDSPEGVIRLASPRSVEEYAQQLYLALRSADQRLLKRVVAWQPIGPGVAFAIRDRLQKARTKS